MKINVFEAYIILNLEDTSKDNGIWRPDLAERVGSPETTIYDHLEILEEKGLIKRYNEKKRKGKGRTRVYWYLTELGIKALEKIKVGMK